MTTTTTSTTTLSRVDREAEHARNRFSAFRYTLQGPARNWSDEMIPEEPGNCTYPVSEGGEK